MNELERIAYIVDDDDGFRESLRVLLDSHGFQTHAFRSGKEFLSVADALDHGCIVLDVEMPDVNGIEVLEQLRNRGNVMPVILVTGSPSSPLLAAVSPANDCHVFEKISDMTKVIETIKIVLQA